MTQKHDTGGPAYPYGREWNRDRSEISRWEENGMTLLDRIALEIAPTIYCRELDMATAAQIIGLTTQEYIEMKYPWAKVVAKESYKFAEAFIAEKRRREGGTC